MAELVVKERGGVVSFFLAMHAGGWIWPAENVGTDEKPDWRRGVIFDGRVNVFPEPAASIFYAESLAMLHIFPPNSPLVLNTGKVAAMIVTGQLPVQYFNPETKTWKTSRVARLLDPETKRADPLGRVQIEDISTAPPGDEVFFVRVYPSKSTKAHFFLYVDHASRGQFGPFFSQIRTAFPAFPAFPLAKRIPHSWEQFLDWEALPRQADTAALLSKTLEARDQSQPMHTFLAAWAIALTVRRVESPRDRRTLARAVALLSSRRNVLAGSDVLLVEYIRFMSRDEMVGDFALLADAARTFSTPVALDDRGGLVHRNVQLRWKWAETAEHAVQMGCKR